MSEDVDVPGGYASMHQRRSESSGDGGRHVRWATVRVGAESGENDADRRDASGDTREGGDAPGPSGRRAASPERLVRRGDERRPRGVPPAASPVRRRATSAPGGAVSSNHTHLEAASGATTTKRPAASSNRERDAAVRAALARPVRLSAILRDNPTCFDPGKMRISVVDKRLSTIDAVPPAYRPAQRLYMSHNNVRHLTGLAQFAELRLLSAGDNPVDDIPQLDALARGCPHLEALSLELCPVARLPFYRAHVIARMPRLKSLDGIGVTPRESERAPRLVRKDVGHLEMLMNAATTADKLRRAYRLAKVHEELRSVVYAPTGPVEPSSLPGRGEETDALDPRLFLRLCAPERTMTQGELAGLAKRLRGAAASEAPEARRTLRASTPPGETLADEPAVWESSYAAVMRREQRDTAALLAFLDDARAARRELRRGGDDDPFGAALRWGFEAARAREAEMRSDREAAVADIIDDGVMRDQVRFGEVLRAEARFGSGTKVNAESDEADDETDADGIVRPPTPRSRAPREPVPRAGNPPRERQETREDTDDDDDDDATYAPHDWARGFDVRVDRDGNASTHARPRVNVTDTMPSRGVGYSTKLPWGHGPGTASEEARRRRAAAKRVGEDAMRAAARAGVSSGPHRAGPSRRVSRSVSPARSHGERERVTSKTTRSSRGHHPSDDSDRAKVYEMLSNEVDALREALESQLGAEHEILSINDELRRRCEDAEQCTEKSERRAERSAREHAGVLARVTNELQEAKELARSLAETLEREREERITERRLADENRNRSEEVLRRKAGQSSEHAAALDRTLAATRAELDDVRGSLTAHLLTEERRVNADAMFSAYAAKRCLRRWLEHAKVAKHGRALRLTCFRRAGAYALMTWSVRAKTQVRARLILARWYRKNAVAALRAWRLGALVSAVGSCLNRRRALRQWRANAEVHKVQRLTREEADARAEFERAEDEARKQIEEEENAARIEAERLTHKKNLGDYADAVLAASSPALRNARKLATLHKCMSTWRIAVIRSQRRRLDELAGTCDDLAAAAEDAAAAAAGVEHKNAELGDAAEALRERCIQAEQRAEEFERAASVESAERKAMEEELDRARERATLSERRAANIGAAKEMETRSAEAAATAATGEAASWRAAAEVGERGIIAAAEALQEWAEEIEREASRTRSPRKGLGTPKMSPKKLGLLASPLSSSLKSPHSMSPSNPVAFLRRVDGSPGLAPEEEARLHSRLEHLPVRARGLHETLRGAIREARALREEAAEKSRGGAGVKGSLTPVQEAPAGDEK